MSPPDEFGSGRRRPFDPHDIPWDEVRKRGGLVFLGLALIAVPVSVPDMAAGMT